MANNKNNGLRKSLSIYLHKETYFLQLVQG